MRTSNINCRQFVETLTPFTANNLSGHKVSGDCYIVKSYSWWPLWACIKGVWYGHNERYSASTSKQRSQSWPNSSKPIILDSCSALRTKINNSD